MPRVLIIAYHFPPRGTGGVGRALGWARHLPDLGWDVSVLAATPAPAWPLDLTLVSQLPQGLAVHRVSPLDFRPARMRGIDHRELSFLWHGPALKRATSLLKQKKFDVILATAPPPVSHRLAAQLGERFGVPWVADFRDPWAVRAPSWWRHWRRRVYASKAACCMAVNPGLALHLEQAFGRKVATVYNGYEPDEIPRDVPKTTRRAVYLGTLSAYNKLTGLFSALSSLGGEFLHIGVERQGDARARARTHGLQRLEQTGYLPRAEALRKAATGSVFITSLDADLILSLPTKTFDYIGLGGPILHLGGVGAASECIRAFELGGTANAEDAGAIAATLERLWTNTPAYPPERMARFTRHRQARDTAPLLAEAAAYGPS